MDRKDSALLIVHFNGEAHESEALNMYLEERPKAADINLSTKTPEKAVQMKEDAKAYAMEKTDCSAQEVDQAFELPAELNQADPDPTTQSVFEYVKAVKDGHLHY